MKGIKPIVMSRKIAREKWKEYIEASKVHGDKYLKDLRGLYYHLKEERKVIDIFEAFKFTGLNEKNEPKLAICKADAKICYFKKENGGSGIFKHNNTWKNEGYNRFVNIPEGTFNNFPLKSNSNWDIAEPVTIQTKVPIVPANKLPKKGNLSDYYILWEVDEWKNVPKDPFLLRRININLFVIISSWNLTKLERALINGRQE